MTRARRSKVASATSSPTPSGFLALIIVHAADIEDRDGAVDGVKAARFRFPWLRHVFGDGGYVGDKLSDVLARMGKGSPRIIKRSDTAKGFELLPRPMARRADIRLARAMPPIGQRLGNIAGIIGRLDTHRIDPHAHATNRKILLRLKNFRIRL